MREIASPGSLYFEERGSGLPIVNLHGWPGEHGQMMAMMEPLFQRPFNWRRIYPDLPGMGKTPGPKWLVSHDRCSTSCPSSSKTSPPTSRSSSPDILTAYCWLVA